jgi:hypothetical protein
MSKIFINENPQGIAPLRVPDRPLAPLPVQLAHVPDEFRSLVDRLRGRAQRPRPAVRRQPRRAQDEPFVQACGFLMLVALVVSFAIWGKTILIVGGTIAGLLLLTRAPAIALGLVLLVMLGAVR